LTSKIEQLRKVYKEKAMPYLAIKKGEQHELQRVYSEIEKLKEENLKLMRENLELKEMFQKLRETTKNMEKRLRQLEELAELGKILEMLPKIKVRKTDSGQYEVEWPEKE